MNLIEPGTLKKSQTTNPWTESRFTKWHFVRHKNPQKLGDTYIIPFLFLSLNLDSVFKFIQRPTNAGHFSFFFKIYLVFLMIFLFVSSNCRKFRQYSRNLLSAKFFVFIANVLFVNRLMRSKSHSKRKMSSIWRPLNGFRKQVHIHIQWNNLD